MPILTEIPGRDVDLVPAETLMRAHPDEFKGLVRLGTPDVLDAVAHAHAAGAPIDPAITLLLSSHDFSLVRLPLSVRPRENVQVRFLAVECMLRADRDQSICWSMTPDRIEDEVTVSTSATVGAELTVGVVKATAETSGDQAVVVYQPHITAFGVGLPDFAWELRPTKGRGVQGVQLLHFVARSPKGTKADCRVRLRVDVSINRLLWNTVAVLDEGSQEVTRFDIASK